MQFFESMIFRTFPVVGGICGWLVFLEGQVFFGTFLGLRHFVEHNFLWFGGSAVSRLKIVKNSWKDMNVGWKRPGRLVENLIIFLRKYRMETFESLQILEICQG